ncbi:type I toxin-antitoxin system Ibs family toxin [Pseudocitrobacter sp. RIT415]|nr:MULTISPECIES: type I toxin-antitoxin system Ibs family toxin [Pseudocitrobacter]RAU53055.1 type I toxin-antitoxin system Ibs family toxin [Pseudocitrobacter sp. RIT 415]UYW75627.1 type I toxin-antitoxin system Ibs family toxin [Pseudocitrobacter faecalis]
MMKLLIILVILLVISYPAY